MPVSYAGQSGAIPLPATRQRVGWALASPRRCKRPAYAVAVQLGPDPPCGRNSVAECFVANEGVASSILAVRSKQSRSSSAVERRFEEPRAGGSTPSFGTMGNEQGLRLALQASHAGSVTPVLHQFSGQSQARCKALPVKQRLARFDSGDRSQHAAVVYGKDTWPLTPWTGVRIPVAVPRARSRRRLRTGDP